MYTPLERLEPDGLVGPADRSPRDLPVGTHTQYAYSTAEARDLGGPGRAERLLPGELPEQLGQPSYEDAVARVEVMRRFVEIEVTADLDHDGAHSGVDSIVA